MERAEGTLNASAPESNTISNSLIEGNVVFTGANGTGTGTINVTADDARGDGSQLDLLDTTTINGVTINIGNSTGGDFFDGR